MHFNKLFVVGLVDEISRTPVIENKGIAKVEYSDFQLRIYYLYFSRNGQQIMKNSRRIEKTMLQLPLARKK